MGTRLQRVVAALVSTALIVSSPAVSAPVRAKARPIAVRTAAAAPMMPQVPPAPPPPPPPPPPPLNETPKERKDREKAEEKARKQAQKEAEHAAHERDKAMHPEREAKRKKLLACAGGAALGILGGILLGGRNKGAAIVAGAIGGCAAGWALGGALKGDDQQRLDHFVNEDAALRDGEPVRTWTAPNSGATITVQLSDGGTKPVQAVFNVAEGVEPPQPGVVIVSQAMRASAGLRLRAAPNTVSAIVGSFALNDIVQVIAQTPDQQWAVVGENNVVVGYVSTSFLSNTLQLQPQAQLRFASMQRTPLPAPKPARARVRRAAAPAPVAPPVASGPPRAVTVAAASHCKLITASYGSNSSSHTRCASGQMIWG
jgi:hypothetical protein